MTLKKYEISVRINGIKKTTIVEAKNKAEATEIGWSMFDVDSIYVTEIED